MKNAALSIITFALIASAVAARPETASVGSVTPSWSLADSTGKVRNINDLRGKYVVLEWTNPDCPFVRKHYDSGNMQATQAKATKSGVIWFSVISSAPGNEGYLTPAEANEYRKSHKVNSTATILDPQGKLGHLYEAKTTPQIVIINPKGVVVYNGAIDDRPTAYPEDIAGAKNYVLAALNSSFAGKPIPNARNRSYGCSVKY